MTARHDTVAHILLELAQGSGGQRWIKERNGWNHGTFVCLWEGIICNSQEEVTEINLVNTGLVATIPESLSQLSHLKHLFLAENKIYGTLPSSIINNLSNLISIDLYKNMIRGPVPEMTNSNLELINLSHNQLSDRLPSDFGEGLPRLRILDLGHNQIGGMIPESVGSMMDLEEMNLSHNSFHGTLPRSLGAMIKLEGLFLSNNKIIGGFPSSLTRDFLPIKEIFLHENNLSGTLPVSLGDLPNLKILSISGNKMTGTIPEELCRRELNTAFLNFASNVVLSRSSNQNNKNNPSCNSIACPVGYTFKDGLSADKQEFECSKCEVGLINPYLGSNACFTTDPKTILGMFYNATDGPNWSKGGDSWPDNSVPVCRKHGITCDAAGDIVAIQLSKMGLSGVIPMELGFLRHVKVLDLSNNYLYGDLPSELRFMPLETLDVSGNMLVGPVPPELCRKNGVNDNGKKGDLNCDVIACGVGSYSQSGNGGDEQCLPCSSNLFLGGKSCKTPSYAGRLSSMVVVPKVSKSEGLYAALGLLILTVAVIITAFVLSKSQKSSKKKPEHIVMEDMVDTVSYHSDISGAESEFMVPSDLGLEAFSEKISKPTWDKKKNETDDKIDWLDVPQVS